MTISGIKKLGLLTGAAAAFLGMTVGVFNQQVQANEGPQVIAQDAAEPEDTCVALQEVTTGQTEIRKRIENRLILRGNWNTDFIVPNDREFAYFVALITAENTGPYEFTANMVLPQGGTEPAFSGRTEVEAGTTYSIPFQSPTGRQPAFINARVGGVNGNFYTIAIAACEATTE
jgi:hypothetical protein